MLVGGVQFRNTLGTADKQAEVAQVTKRHADGIAIMSENAVGIIAVSPLNRQIEYGMHSMGALY